LAKKDNVKNKSREFLNKKVFHNFIVEDIFEVGIELKGSEVKSIREGRMNFKESFVRIIKNEVYILNMHISPLDTTHTTYRPDEYRDKKLLLHRKQINKLFEKVTKDGYTIVATKLYFNKNNIVKLNIGIAKGKKLHDKR
jgi:SsrA-binding protein